MFIVINKEKINTYIVSIMTVVVLFLTSDLILKDITVQTSSQLQNDYIISNVDIEEKNIAYTFNCITEDDDIDTILKILKDNNIKVNFFVSQYFLDNKYEKVIEIYEEEHELGLYIDYSKNLTEKEIIEYIEVNNEKIENLTNKENKLLRIESIHETKEISSLIIEQGYYLIGSSNIIEKGNIISGNLISKMMYEDFNNILLKVQLEKYSIVYVSELVNTIK